MTGDKPSYEELERRVAEAEAVLEALRKCEVDAIVGEGSVSFVRVRELEEALRSSEARFRAVAENTHDWEFWLAPDGRPIYVSPSVERITGFPAQAFLDDPNLMLDVVHPDDRAELAGHLRRASTGEVGELEFRVVRADGETRWIAQVVGAVEDRDGSPLGLRGSNRDVTERRELVNALFRSSRLAAMGKLAGSIAHELRNPLGTIRNATYLLRVGIESPDPIVAEAVDLIGREVDAADHIIASIIEYAAARPPRPLPTDLNELVRAALSRWGQPETVELVFEPSVDLPEVVVDRERLLRAVSNLVDNAVDAMAGGGRVQVTTSRPDPEHVALSVADSGPGIPSEKLEAIFEPLYTEKERGLGLGLAIVRDAAESHGGRVEVDSRPGEGATFTVILPL